MCVRLKGRVEKKKVEGKKWTGSYLHIHSRSQGTDKMYAWFVGGKGGFNPFFFLFFFS